MKKSIICLVLILLAAIASANVVDAPHNKTNGMKCSTCHNYSLWWEYSPVTSTSNPNKTTVVNSLCATCHGNVALCIPQTATHSSTTINSTLHNTWGVGCTDCHNPHYQGQLTWIGSSTDLYLASGTISSSTYDSVADQSTIAYIANTINPNWPVTIWSDKSASNPNRGLILVHDKVAASNTFSIVSATESQIVVKGKLPPDEIDPAHVNPQGQDNSPTCDTFGLIYGQLIKDTIASKPVKFFDPTGGFVEGGADTTGICQVCHTETSHYTNSGVLPSNPDSHTGRETGNCIACHNHNAGFKGSGHDGTSFVWAGTCGTCHDADHSIVNITTEIHGRSCGLCHVNPAGGGPRRDGDAAYGVDGSALGGTNASSCIDCHITKLGLTGGTIHHVSAHDYAAAGNCTQCHQEAAGKLASNHTVLVAADSNCTTTCHTDTAGTATGAPVDPNNPKVHDTCTTCHETTGALKTAYGKASSMPSGSAASNDGGGTCTACHGAYFASHSNINHLTRVASSNNCISCHTATPGTATTVPLSVSDNKVHDSCSTCHNTNGSLKTAYGKASSMPTNGGDCNGCHGAYFTNHINIDHTAKVAMNANCSSCHEGTQGTATGVPTDNLNNMLHDGCTTCHDGSNGALVGSAAGHAGGGDCLTCHAGHDTALVHNNRVTTDLTTDCTSCHAAGSASAIDTLHTSCQTCHAYVGNKLDPAVVAMAIATGKGASGTAQNCERCHTVNLHHTTNEATNNNCTTICHQNVNHSSKVIDTSACTTCHTGTAGTANGIPLSLVDAAVHDSCRTCHTFDAQWRCILVNFTNQKGVNGSGALSAGGGGCTVCHTVAATTNMATLGVLHHKSYRAAQGQCEYCHADPMPSWGTPGPGDNVNGSLSGSGWPTQMACRGCHVSFSGGAMAVTKFTRSSYSSYSSAWTRTTAHTLPVTGISINNYGICMGCHYVGSSKVPASAQVTIWHARPDKHGGSDWTFYNQTSSGTLGKKDTRYYCFGDVAHYAPGRSSSAIGGFNLFAPNYGMYSFQSQHEDENYANHTQGHDCGDPASRFTYQYPVASAPFIKITLPALTQLGTTTSQAVPVFASIAPKTGAPSLGSPTATTIGSTTATLGANITTSGTSDIITARGTVWGTSANPTGNPVAEGGTATGLFSQPRTSLPAGTKIYYRGYATSSEGTGYSPDGSFYTEPAAQASLGSFTAVGQTDMTVNWTRGTGDGVIVLMKQGSAVTAAPTDGTYTSYSANTTFGSGTQIVSGTYVVYKGAGTSAAVTGLTGNTSYSLAVYEYKGVVDTSGVGTGTNYKSTPATGSQVTTPALTSPTATSIGTTTATLGGTLTAGGDATITARGTVWGTSTNPTGNALAEGGTATGAFSQARSGLPAGSPIYYRAYASNSAGTGYSPVNFFYTEPATQASGVNFTAVGATTMTVNWTRGSGIGVLVLMQQGAAVSAEPVDGSDYTASSIFGGGTQIGTGNYVIYKGTGTSVAITGLLASASYHVAVFEFSGYWYYNMAASANYKAIAAIASQTTP